MINSHRGEVEITINGRPFCLCLTLGALAQLETGFAVGNLVELASRFEGGKLASEDLLTLLEAALAGGGNPIPKEQLLSAKIEGGLGGAMKALTRLLNLTFGQEPSAA